MIFKVAHLTYQENRLLKMKVFLSTKSSSFTKLYQVYKTSVMGLEYSGLGCVVNPFFLCSPILYNRHSSQKAIPNPRKTRRSH